MHTDMRCLPGVREPSCVSLCAAHPGAAAQVSYYCKANGFCHFSLAATDAVQSLSEDEWEQAATPWSRACRRYSCALTADGNSISAVTEVLPVDFWCRWQRQRPSNVM